jgi:V8-like Glu-specific endopeptidase
MIGHVRNCCLAAALLAASLAIAACERTQVEAAPLRASAAGQGEDLAAIQLDRIVFNLQRGQLIGSYRGGGGWTGCGPDLSSHPINWTQGKMTVRDEEVLDIFYREMRGAHYNVVGDPDALFGNYDDRNKEVEYLVGGRVDTLTLDVCDEVDNWDGRPLGRQHGAAAVAVTWQVFSTLENKVMFETRTEGSIDMPQGVSDGEIALILGAFSAAARNLAGDPRFHDVLLRRNHAQTAAAAPLSGWGEVPAQPPIALPPMQLFTTPIATNMARIQASVVTIFSGVGQGSGFFVTPELVLTNHHVAHDAKRLKLVFLNGTEVYATTLRSDPKRDVALLKVEGGPFTPLPLRLSALALTEEVYAVGSPLDPSLAGTVTRGIVSQMKENEYGQPLIQADATIQHGSSGGPLLDAKGNVIGISQSAFTDQGEYSVGINFFIPIADGVQRLGLELQ